MKLVKLISWTLVLFMIMQASIAQSKTGLVISTWVLLGPEGTATARAVTTNSKCPSILFYLLIPMGILVKRLWKISKVKN
jgi:hypothetical protein